MSKYQFGSIVDRNFRNTLQRMADYISEMGYTYEESLQKAQDILAEAQQTNDMNESVQQQINALIVESGTSDAEVLQARIDGEGNEYPVLKERLDKKEQSFSTQLAQIEEKNSVSPEDFKHLIENENNYYLAIQEAFNFAIENNKSINLPHEYEIGDNTISLNKGSDIRYRTLIFGGGTIKKSSNGAIFNATNISSSDFFFSGITFEGIENGDVIVFDTGRANLIRIKTNQCYFDRIKTVFYSDVYVQDISMSQDTVVHCHGSVLQCHGTYGFFVDKLTHEKSSGSFLEQTNTDETTSVGNTLTNFKVENSIIEGFTQAGGSKAIFNVRSGTVVLEDNYFEGVPRGVVDIIGTAKVIASRNQVYGTDNNNTEFPFVKLTSFTGIGRSEFYNNNLEIPLLDNTLIPIGGAYPIIDDNTSLSIIGHNDRVVDLALNRGRLKRHTVIRSTVEQEILSNIETNMEFDNIQNYGGVDVTLDTDGFSINENGIYLITVVCRWDDASVDNRVMEIERDQRVSISGRNTQHRFDIVRRITTPTKETIRAFHTNPNPLSIASGTRVDIVRIGDV